MLTSVMIRLMVTMIDKNSSGKLLCLRSCGLDAELVQISGRSSLFWVLDASYCPAKQREGISNSLEAAAALINSN